MPLSERLAQGGRVPAHPKSRGATGLPSALGEVIVMQRYLLVLDMDLLARVRNSSWSRSTIWRRGQNKSGVKSWCCRWWPAAR